VETAVSDVGITFTAIRYNKCAASCEAAQRCEEVLAARYVVKCARRECRTSNITVYNEEENKDR